MGSRSGHPLASGQFPGNVCECKELAIKSREGRDTRQNGRVRGVRKDWVQSLDSCQCSLSKKPEQSGPRGWAVTVTTALGARAWSVQAPTS